MIRIVLLFVLLLSIMPGQHTWASSSKQPNQPQHHLGIHLSYINDHADVDTGWYPELRYSLDINKWVGLEAGIRFGFPGDGDLLRYFLAGKVQFPVPLTRTVALRMAWMHSTFTDIQKGENLLVFLNVIDTKHFYFQGGFAIRFPLLAPEAQWNPFRLDTQYVETTLLFDIRGKLEFTFPKLGGSVLQVGLGVMDFLPTDILTSNSFGYQLFGIWKQPKIGSFELNVGMFSYSFLDLAGYYGRFFLHFRYTYTFGGPTR